MLLTCLISQLGSTGTLPPGCGGVQKAVHMRVGGVTRMFHPRKKHLPVSPVLVLIWDVMTTPLFWSTSRLVAPSPWYTLVGLFPATELSPSKTVKLSTILPVNALRA